MIIHKKTEWFNDETKEFDLPWASCGVRSKSLSDNNGEVTCKDCLSIIQDRKLYGCGSINPYDDDFRRKCWHSDCECALLNTWQGTIMERYDTKRMRKRCLEIHNCSKELTVLDQVRLAEQKEKDRIYSEFIKNGGCWITMEQCTRLDRSKEKRCDECSTLDLV